MILTDERVSMDLKKNIMKECLDNKKITQAQLVHVLLSLKVSFLCRLPVLLWYGSKIT